MEASYADAVSSPKSFGAMPLFQLESAKLKSVPPGAVAVTIIGGFCGV
jgi:hypothetical protein